MRHLLVSLLGIAVVATSAAADTTPQPLPFTQNWTDLTQITADDNWSGVPGITGYLGQNITTASNGADPQLLLTESTLSPDIDVIANATTPATSTSGGVAEFHITNPTIALQGSGTADAPYVLLALNTTGAFGIRITYNVRDVDDNATDNAIQQVALQYRVGTTGNFTNLPQGYVADATTIATATQVTAINVLLPPAVDNQPVVQIRMISTNAQGADEWVGIDDINVFDDPTSPTAVGMSSPSSAPRGGNVTVTAAVTPGTVPASTGVAVVCDLSSIGGSATQALFDDATNGDGLAGDNVFTFATTVAIASAPGAKTFACSVSDAQVRSSTFNISFTVAANCGDGIMEGAEACDDSGTNPGDGCSATCTLEPGFDCQGTAPTTCIDINECAQNNDNCSANATCSNTIGAFSCTCNAGYSGDGVTCTDIDECAQNNDNCSANAMCMNQNGGFSCTCNAGYSGDGVTCTDIDECAQNNDDCVAGATCTNANGGFSCTCAGGFTGDGRASGTGCTDIDECAANTDNCSANAACTNTIGAFSCACNTGFSGNGVTCTDIDECTANTDDCVTAATCNNTVGAYTCACPTGYTGNGLTSGTGCTDLDECTTNTDNCATNATCTNTVGSFTCACLGGFTGNGVTCTDVDECAAATDNCDTNATCTNTAGSFTCACAAGYSGTGVTCAPNCGDGVVAGTEACDDNNMAAGDGCTANCVVEEGYTCSGTPNVCRTVCGDGLKVGAEECDDADTVADDGCSASCTVEEGWTCTGEPSTCDAPDDGGCCSSSTNPGGVALLVMFVMIGLRRRKRAV